MECFMFSVDLNRITWRPFPTLRFLIPLADEHTYHSWTFSVSLLPMIMSLMNCFCTFLFRFHFGFVF
jgi:hypothetical protein